MLCLGILTQGCNSSNEMIDDLKLIGATLLAWETINNLKSIGAKRLFSKSTFAVAPVAPALTTTHTVIPDENGTPFSEILHKQAFFKSPWQRLYMLQISWPSHTNLYIGWDAPKSSSHPGESRGCKVAIHETFCCIKIKHFV